MIEGGQNCKNYEGEIIRDMNNKQMNFFQVFALILSSNVLVALSIDRFYVIVYPMKIGNEGRQSSLITYLQLVLTVLF